MGNAASGVCGALLAAAFAAFLFNIVMTVGLKGAIGIFRSSPIATRELVPPPAGASPAAA